MVIHSENCNVGGQKDFGLKSLNFIVLFRFHCFSTILPVFFMRNDSDQKTIKRSKLCEDLLGSL